jgi:sugar/nucleoside kinase (ribokinase family)
LGPKIVCITDKKKFVTAYDGLKTYKLKPHKIKVVERTGAGDAFASGFVAGLIRGKDIKFSLKIGLANAESVIRYFGAKNKLLTWREAFKHANKSQ